MSGALLHSAADVVRRLIIGLGLGSDPPATPWPVFAAGEPSVPPDLVVVFDTTSRQHGRDAPTSTRVEHHGVQIKVRAAEYEDAWAKARAIAVALDGVDKRVVTMPAGTRYLVNTVVRTSDVLPLLKEIGEGKRGVLTVNGVVSMRML